MAQTVITTSSISRLLLNYLKGVFSDYNTKPDQWHPIYKIVPSERKREYFEEMRLLPNAAQKDEGAAIYVGDAGQFVTTMIENQAYGISAIFTREAIKYNQYKQDFPRIAKALMNSLTEVRNINTATPINNGFDSLQPIGDGQPLYSLVHPTYAGTFANTFSTAADLSETNLEDAITQVQLFPSASGQLLNLEAELLVIPNALQFQAKRLLESKYRVGTANNDINALYNNTYISKGEHIFSYMTNTTQWMIKTTEENGFVYLDSEKPVKDITTNDSTYNVKATIFEYYGIGVLNARCTFSAVGV